MPRFQTSFILSQRDWPGAGDIDDCWLVADLAALHACAPWLPLVGASAYRRAAGNPDVQGEPNGGQLRHSIKALRELYPDYAQRFHAMSGESWTTLMNAWADGRATSVSLTSSELPPSLRYGFGGFHRVSILRTPGGVLLFANPLAPGYSRWEQVEESDIRPAILAYGKAKEGKPCAYAVTFPTLLEALDVYRPLPAPPVIPPDCHPQAEVDAAYNGGVEAAAAAVAAVPRRAVP